VTAVKAIIIGAGEVGFHIANHMTLEKMDVVVIDVNPQALRRVSDHIDVKTVLGSGSSPVILKAAGLKGAEIVLAVTNSDEVNLVACMMVDLLSPDTKKLARLRKADLDGYHSHFHKYAPHIDTIINPEIEVVKTISRLLQVSGATEVNEFADGAIKLVGIKLDETAGLAGKRLTDIQAESGEAWPLVAAIIRDEKLLIPMGKDRLEAGDEIYIVEKEDRLAETLLLFGKPSMPVRRLMIIGGGAIGLRLATSLENSPMQIKIIEKDAGRCEALAAILDKAIVIHGDGSDQALLKEENIHDTDIAVMLTNDEETNILASLLAKRLGAKKAITKISRFSYFPLVASVGIEKVVSPRLSAINSILHHIRQGKVLSAISLRGEQAEVIEAEVTDASGIVNRALRSISFPKGVLVTGIVHNDSVSIPSGESVIYPGDRIVIFARKEAISRLEKILAVKLEYV
jgi:trk system potassium uptake protein TrkA